MQYILTEFNANDDTDAVTRGWTMMNKFSETEVWRTGDCANYKWHTNFPNDIGNLDDIGVGQFCIQSHNFWPFRTNPGNFGTW